MFVPHSYGTALFMMIATAVCWGSYASTYKCAKNYRFELFYWDYAVGIFLVSLALAFTMGSTPADSSSFLNNVHVADNSNIIAALVGGAVFNLASVLLFAAIALAGLALAFPVCVGIALVVGVILTYILQPRGSPYWLAAGVACALVAVILDGKAYGSLASGRRSTSKKSLAISIASGVLMGFWAPFVTRAMSSGNTLGPYSTGVFFTLGAFLSCFIWNAYFMKKPLAGEPVNFGEYFRGPAAGHILGLLGGAIWGIGTVFNFVAAHFTGVAVSFALGQSSAMVAALWGVFVWKEFRGANRQAITYLGFMFAFFILAILFISHAI
jgi:glucose uptake protein